MTERRFKIVYEGVQRDLCGMRHAFKVILMGVPLAGETSVFDEVCDWCRAKFGLPTMDGRWRECPLAILIKGDNDAFEFRLRWC